MIRDWDKMKEKLKKEFFPFHHHPNANSSTSFGKRKPLRAGPTKKLSLIGTLELRNPSPSGIFECFKYGEPILELQVGEKVCERILNSFFVKEVRESCSDDDYEYKNVSMFDEYPSEKLEGVFEDDCVFEIEDEYDSAPIFDEFPRQELEYEDIFEDFSIFGGDYEDLPVYDDCSNEDIDDNNEEEGLEDIDGSHEEQDNA
jgi:hypothetical protein